jgi:DNA-binding IclR family transcriptional regulator
MVHIVTASNLPGMTRAEVPAARGTQLIARSTTLLRLIANANHQGARLVDLTRHSGLERPTVRRILQGLIEEGLVRQHDGDRRYYLGMLMFELGLAAARGIDMPAIAAPSLDRIARETEDTVYLVQRSGLDAVCIDRREGSFPVKVLTIDIGARRPLGAAAGGLAILAGLPSEERSFTLAANRSQMASYEKLYGMSLEAAVEDAMRRGFALMPINVVPYVSAVAVTIPSRTGTPHAALSVSALSNRIMDGERFVHIARLLRIEAAAIATALHASAWASPHLER